ncbi:hypothetical protein FG152_22110 [Ochrobactrum sp. XJ1]|nr:hypothetical protein [Ochrobactrum sp. XJ1]
MTTLPDLVGKHMLDAVDFTNEKTSDDDWCEDSQVCRFRLDDVTYKAIEDPDDGYRSHLKELVLDPNAKMNNVFPAVLVVAEMKPEKPDKEAWEHDRTHDILIFKDALTGLPVLEIGTDNTDDYYPSFVANFSPQNMAINHLMGEVIFGGEEPSE